jgi:hypothetical protein
MTHLHPAGPRRLATPPISVASRQMPLLIGNRDWLLTALVSKRARVAALEAA